MMVTTTASAVDVDQHPPLKQVVDTLVSNYDFDRQALRELFKQVELNMRIIEIMQRPGEAKPWYKYRDLFVTAPSARRGVRFWRKHKKVLRHAKKHYGVNPAYIVAIIGVETRYGRFTGGLRIIDSLATLTVHYPRRSRFFSNQLIHFLLLAKEQRMEPLSIKGSYAGAIGAPQFMPSSYRAYAVDFDGDDTADLMRSMADSIGSVANYFREHGWKSNQPVCTPIKSAGTVHTWLSDLEVPPMMTVSEFARFGVRPVDRGIDPKLKAALIELKGKDGPEYRMVFDNFFVVLKYNRSYKYAMAVCDLGRSIEQRYRRAQ